MVCQYKNLFLLLFFSFQTFLLSQECDSGFVWLEDVPVSCGGEYNCFYEADLNVLQAMIDNSSETINMLLDNNEDDIIDPVEPGYTEWIEDRLVALNYFLTDIMSCNLSGLLSQNIGDLEHLETLWLTGNQLPGEIPESLGNLVNLEILYLSNNQLSGSMSESLCSLDIDWSETNTCGVEYFNIWGQ